MSHEGHRQRILERLKRDGEGLCDHELLEILLFNAIPRKNTNDIAHALLEAFGSLKGVLSADLEMLSDVEGIGASTAAYLRCIGLMYDRVGKKERQRLVFNTRTFIDYLTERYLPLREEVLEVYCLNKQGCIVGSKRFTSSVADRVVIAPEEVSKYISSAHPPMLVLAHNHVGVPSAPSEQDDRFTAQIQMLCSINNVDLRDHIVIGSDGAFSYSLSGRLARIRRSFNIHHVIAESEK